jgi:hypothetical protein
MENHNGLNLILKVRSICRRAAAEGKTTVSRNTLRQIDRQIRQMGGSARGQAELFARRSV